MDKVYPIEKLPSILFLGKRTENEVTKVGIDCAAYLALWPDMTFTVWPTLPNADECYAAAQVQTENGILTWTINSYDVSVAGDGTVEIVGVTPDNSKKISHTVRTRIDQTTLPDRAMPGDPDTLFVEAVAKEAGRAEKAAQEAAEARKGAEAERKAAEEAAEKVLAGEGGRVEAEKLREENERARVKNEEERVNAENTRKSSETTRENSETERVNAENTRKSSETVRAKNEEERVNAENTRKSNETARTNSETERVNAENTRKSSETVRAKNEEERVNAENTRKSNETTRENSETERVEAEKLREENERARVKNEEERVNAENTRKSSETTRTNSETKRVNAENKRIEDEKQRIEAEKQRELAEEKREEVIAHVPKIDQTLSHDGEAADAGAVGRALDDKLDKEGEWELIEEFTTKMDAAFERTAEPDGTPYNFSALKVNFSIDGERKDKTNIPVFITTESAGAVASSNFRCDKYSNFVIQAKPGYGGVYEGSVFYYGGKDPYWYEDRFEPSKPIFARPSIHPIYRVYAYESMIPAKTKITIEAVRRK